MSLNLCDDEVSHFSCFADSQPIPGLGFRIHDQCNQPAPNRETKLPSEEQRVPSSSYSRRDVHRNGSCTDIYIL